MEDVPQDLVLASDRICLLKYFDLHPVAKFGLLVELWRDFVSTILKAQVLCAKFVCTGIYYLYQQHTGITTGLSCGRA